MNKMALQYYPPCAFVVDVEASKKFEYTLLFII